MHFFSLPNPKNYKEPERHLIKSLLNTFYIDIDLKEGSIAIKNNGQGIPVEFHKTEKLWLPDMLFGHLLTSSNYEDDVKKVTGGRNGYGAKLCNMYSKEFSIETVAGKKKFFKSWSNNMKDSTPEEISKSNSSDYTKVTFKPDLAKFKLKKLTRDFYKVVEKRAYDVAATSGCKVWLNGEKLKVDCFEKYCKMFVKDENEILIKKLNKHWEVGVALSDEGYGHVSFCNSISTTLGGKHVDYVLKGILEEYKKVNPKANVKDYHVKNHLMVFLNAMVENPTFDSQTKEHMTLGASKFLNSKTQLPAPIDKSFVLPSITEAINKFVKYDTEKKLKSSTAGITKVNKPRNIPKLEDAHLAGTKDSLNCTLILTEGDSAKTTAICGLSVIGRQNYGVFPLRGKMLNVREANVKQVLNNQELNNILAILGLKYKEKFESKSDLKKLRYGKIMIMTDQDHDGVHIKGLLINFIHNYWPNLLKHGFLDEFITPLVKVSKGKTVKPFYSMQAYENWRENPENDAKSWKVKYYKGLGTSTPAEAKEYFSNIKNHRINLFYKNDNCFDAIERSFSREEIDNRKTWLTEAMDEEKPKPELKRGTKKSYQDFVNHELIEFSKHNLERTMPSIIDGLKPTQRKILWTMLNHVKSKELKVTQLAGAVSEKSCYHHGESSLHQAIIKMAHDFPGSNNLNLLKPIGQFGSRLMGGNDASSPRYIFTALQKYTRYIFSGKDDPILTSVVDDGQEVEPEHYFPIIPMVLINGAKGIGTGWSTFIPNFNEWEIITQVENKIKNDENRFNIVPKYRHFDGKIEDFWSYGKVSRASQDTVRITELPVGVWTQNYIEKVLEPYVNEGKIKEYQGHYTEDSVDFMIEFHDRY